MNSCALAVPQQARSRHTHFILLCSTSLKFSAYHCAIYTNRGQLNFVAHATKKQDFESKFSKSACGTQVPHCWDPPESIVPPQKLWCPTPTCAQAPRRNKLLLREANPTKNLSEPKKRKIAIGPIEFGGSELITSERKRFSARLITRSQAVDMIADHTASVTADYVVGLSDCC